MIQSKEGRKDIEGFVAAVVIATALSKLNRYRAVNSNLNSKAFELCAR